MTTQLTKKSCTRCHKIKSISEFYRVDSHHDNCRNYCKKCSAIAVRKWQETNRTHYNVLLRNWFNFNRERYNETRRKLKSVNRDKYTATTRKHRRMYPDRYTARMMLSTALQLGHVIPLSCMWPGCDSKNRIEGHHPNYSKPREIVWLCRKHHLLADKENGNLSLPIYILPKSRNHRKCLGKGLCCICGQKKMSDNDSYCRECRSGYEGQRYLRRLHQKELAGI